MKWSKKGAASHELTDGIASALMYRLSELKMLKCGFAALGSCFLRILLPQIR